MLRARGWCLCLCCVYVCVCMCPRVPVNQVMALAAVVGALLCASALAGEVEPKGNAPVDSQGSIFVAAYWPNWTGSKLVRFDYVSEDGSLPPFASVFSYDAGSNSMLYNNYDASMNWLNR